jgi:hypothetical protein
MYKVAELEQFTFQNIISFKGTVGMEVHIAVVLQVISNFQKRKLAPPNRKNCKFIHLGMRKEIGSAFFPV